jgi:hypothetical protein
MSKAGIVKRHLEWVDAETIARGMRIPWSPYVIKKLIICESVIQSQENQRVEMAMKSE